MSYGVKEFIKTATSQFIDDCAMVIGIAEIPCNHVEAVFLELKTNSQRRVNKSRNRAEIYNRFLVYKDHFAKATDRDGKYVFHFLCGVEALDLEQSEQMICKVTAFIDAEQLVAVKQIGKAMRKVNQAGMLNITNSRISALEN